MKGNDFRSICINEIYHLLEYIHKIFNCYSMIPKWCHQWYDVFQTGYHKGVTIPYFECFCEVIRK